MNFNNKTILISGGTGSFANQFIEHIIKKKIAKKIIVFSRDEYKQSLMKNYDYVKKNPKIFRFFLGLFMYGIIFVISISCIFMKK